MAVVIMSFASADDASTAVLLLHLRGFDAGSVACYTIAQMRRPGPLGTWGLSPHFIAALAGVGETDMATTMSYVFASRFAEEFGLVLKKPPLPILDLELTVVWSHLRAADPVLAWVRGVRGWVAARSTALAASTA